MYLELMVLTHTHTNTPGFLFSPLLAASSPSQYKVTSSRMNAHNNNNNNYYYYYYYYYCGINMYKLTELSPTTNQTL